MNCEYCFSPITERSCFCEGGMKTGKIVWSKNANLSIVAERRRRLEREAKEEAERRLKESTEIRLKNLENKLGIVDWLDRIAENTDKRIRELQDRLEKLEPKSLQQ